MCLCSHACTCVLSLAVYAGVNVQKDDGSTPLYSASHGGHKSVVEFLVASGAGGSHECGVKQGIVMRISSCSSVECFDFFFLDLVSCCGGNVVDLSFVL